MTSKMYPRKDQEKILQIPYCFFRVVCMFLRHLWVNAQLAPKRETSARSPALSLPQWVVATQVTKCTVAKTITTRLRKPPKYGKWSLSIVLWELQHYINKYDGFMVSAVFVFTSLHQTPMAKPLGPPLLQLLVLSLSTRKWRYAALLSGQQLHFSLQDRWEFVLSHKFSHQTHRATIPISWGSVLGITYCLPQLPCHHHSCGNGHGTKPKNRTNYSISHRTRCPGKVFVC